MCDDSLPGVCAVGSFLSGTLMASAFGLVSEAVTSEYRWSTLPGLCFGATLGTLAAAFPDGPDRSAVLSVVGSGFVGAVAACATIDGSDAPGLLIRAVLASAAANAGLLSSGALHRRRRRRSDKEEALLIE